MAVRRQPGRLRPVRPDLDVREERVRRAVRRSHGGLHRRRERVADRLRPLGRYRFICTGGAAGAEPGPAWSRGLHYGSGRLRGGHRAGQGVHPARRRLSDRPQPAARDHLRGRSVLRLPGAAPDQPLTFPLLRAAPRGGGGRLLTRTDDPGARWHRLLPAHCGNPPARCVGERGPRQRGRPAGRSQGASRARDAGRPRPQRPGAGV